MILYIYQIYVYTYCYFNMFMFTFVFVFLCLPAVFVLMYVNKMCRFPTWCSSEAGLAGVFAARRLCLERLVHCKNTGCCSKTRLNELAPTTRTSVSAAGHVLGVSAIESVLL